MKTLRKTDGSRLQKLKNNAPRTVDTSSNDKQTIWVAIVAGIYNRTPVIHAREALMAHKVPAIKLVTETNTMISSS